MSKERAVNFPQNVPFGTTHYEKGRTWEYSYPGMWKSIGGSGGGGLPGGGEGVEEAPLDGAVYGRQNATWVEVVADEYEPPSYEVLRTSGEMLKVKTAYIVNISTNNPYVNLPVLGADDEGQYIVVSDGGDGWSVSGSHLTVNLNGPLQNENVGQLVLDLDATQITFVWDGTSWWVFSTMSNTPADSVGTVTTADVLLTNPQRATFTTQEDANQWFHDEIVDLNTSGGGGGGTATNVEWDDILNKPQPIKDLAAENTPKQSFVAGGRY
jgi:hypothetical protein